MNVINNVIFKVVFIFSLYIYMYKQYPGGFWQSYNLIAIVYHPFRMLGGAKAKLS